MRSEKMKSQEIIPSKDDLSVKVLSKVLDPNRSDLLRTSSLRSLSSSLAVNVGCSSPERQANSAQVPSQTKRIVHSGAGTSAQALEQPLVTKRKSTKMFPPDRNRNKNNNSNNNNNKDSYGGKILPRPGKSTSALMTRPKTAPSFSYNTRHFSRRSSKQVLDVEPPMSNGRNKLFEIHGTNACWDVRKSLTQRGWVEKPVKKKSVIGLTKSKTSFISIPEDSKVSLHLEFNNYHPGFIWTSGRIMWELLRDEQIVNQIPSPMFAFTSKVGLVSCVQNSHWFLESGKTNARCPRCYRLSISEERLAFISDYLHTACISFIHYLVRVYEKYGATGIMDSGGRVSQHQLSFALKHIRQYARKRMHDDLDDPSTRENLDDEWEIFLEHHNRLVFSRGKLALKEGQEIVLEGEAKYNSAKEVLTLVTPYWPQMNIDGFHNVWICKPGEMSRGKGIVIMNNIGSIVQLFPNKNKAWMNTVVQKYIERPFLIYNTKFDIRQWFLISRWNPLTVWFYKEAYLRFCSKPFSIEDLHEKAHLCNHAVQSKYSIAKSRSMHLPQDNIWDCTMFREHLAKEGQAEIWDTIIQPGMKEGILGVLLSSQDDFFSKNVIMRKNSFQLFGADFMISDDYTPWLIEINSNPDMSKDTKVLKRLVSSCIEDLIKVVIDRRANPKAETGNFQLLYQEQELNMPLKINHKPGNTAMDCYLRGKRLRIPSGGLKKISISNSSKTVRVSKSTKSIKSQGFSESRYPRQFPAHSKKERSDSSNSRGRSKSKSSIKLFLNKIRKKSKSKSPQKMVDKSRSRRFEPTKDKSAKSKSLLIIPPEPKTPAQSKSKVQVPEGNKKKPSGTKNKLHGKNKSRKDAKGADSSTSPDRAIIIKPTIGTDIVNASKASTNKASNNINEEDIIIDETDNNNVTLSKSPNIFKTAIKSPLVDVNEDDIIIDETDKNSVTLSKSPNTFKTSLTSSLVSPEESSTKLQEP